MAVKDYSRVELSTAPFRHVEEGH